MDEVVENRAEEKSGRSELSFLAGGKRAEIGVLRNEIGGFVFSPGVLPPIIKEMEIRSPFTERAAPSFEELAAQQGVQPVFEFDYLVRLTRPTSPQKNSQSFYAAGVPKEQVFSPPSLTLSSL
jgi:hypothetical protein